MSVSLSGYVFGVALLLYTCALVALATGRELFHLEREFTFSVVVPVAGVTYFGLAVWAFSENCMSTQLCPVTVSAWSEPDDPNHTVIPMSLFIALFGQGLVSCCTPLRRTPAVPWPSRSLLLSDVQLLSTYLHQPITSRSELPTLNTCPLADAVGHEQRT